MGWERRGLGGRMVYYRAVRTADGKVVKQHLGRGERAVSAAAAVARSKSQREADRQAVKEEQARLAGPEGLLLELICAAQLLLEATLLVSGYHRPNWGKWRKKRRGEQERNRDPAQSRHPRRDQGRGEQGQAG